jgi:hypothetical protein
MRNENKRMKAWLAENGIEAMPKYIKDGSMRGCWRLYGGKCGDRMWYGNKELQSKLTKLGFVDFNGDPLDDYSGNGGDFSIFPQLTNKQLEQEFLSDEIASSESLYQAIVNKDQQAIGSWESQASSGQVCRIM